jgi:DivIVA domain-containing protein
VSLFLVFLAIAAAGAVALAVSGRVSRRAKTEAGQGWERGEVPALDGLSEADPRLPAVLLPEHPVASDIDRLRFSVAFRGYRMDQVDQVLDRLRRELAARDELISEFRRERHWKNDDGTPLPPAS